MLKNLSTAKKLYLLPLFFIVFVIIGAITYFNLMSTSATRSNVALKSLDGLTIIADARISSFELFLEPSQKNLDTMNNKFAKVKNYIKALNVKALDGPNKLGTGTKLINDGVSNINKYINVTNSYMLKKLALLKQGIKTNPPGFQRISDLSTLYIEKTVRDLRDIKNRALELRTSAISELSITLGILVIIAIVLFLLLSFSISRTVISSLNNFKSGLLSFFAFLNKESKEVRLLNDKNKDEFGQMAKLVNQNITSTQIGIKQDQALIEETIKVLGEFEQGDLSQRLHLDVKNESLQKLKNVLNEMAKTLESNVENVLKVLQEYSNHNFIHQASKEGLKGLLLHLANNTNTLGNATTKDLVSRKGAGLTLGNVSENLLRYVNNLNNSSNEAAASLEETAAALEQITGNTRNNTANIDKMVDLSSNVTSSVKDGEKLASDTSKAMEDINAQVNAINEAISVIDQIAFQTNILSLNAAVEAATAGEAGKGFAVVAGEVRNLASRSAEAAKEIKDMVENATKKADEGKTMSSNMISGYVKLNESVSQTINLISDVKMASKEQLLGIEQINDAVNQLDRQTQQNAQIASQTNDVSLMVSEISKNIIKRVDTNIFIGSDDVEAEKVGNINLGTKQNKIINELETKKIEDDIQTPMETKVSKKREKTEAQKLSTADAAVLKAKTSNAKKPNIIKDTSSALDDEWESF